MDINNRHPNTNGHPSMFEGGQSKYNGRVDVMDKQYTPFMNTDEELSQNDKYNPTAIKNIHTKDELNDLYFSKVNIDALQQGIRYSVFKKSSNKHIIGDQSETELKVIMRSMYLQYGKNKPYDIVQQVRELNKLVLDYAVPRILSQIEQNIGYRKEISSLPVPLERAQNESVKGTKVLFRKEF